MSRHLTIEKMNEVSLEEALGFGHAEVILTDKESISGSSTLGFSHSEVILTDKDTINGPRNLGLSHGGIMLTDKESEDGSRTLELSHAGFMLADKETVGASRTLGLSHAGIMLSDKESVSVSRPLGLSHAGIILADRESISNSRDLGLSHSGIMLPEKESIGGSRTIELSQSGGSRTIEFSQSGVLLTDKESIVSSRDLGLSSAGEMEDKDSASTSRALELNHASILLADKEGIVTSRALELNHAGILLADKEGIVSSITSEGIGLGHRSILMQTHSSESLGTHLHHIQVEGDCSRRPDSVHGHTLSSIRSVGCPDPSLLSNIFQDTPGAESLIVPLPPMRLSDQIVPATSYLDTRVVPATSFMDTRVFPATPYMESLDQLSSLAVSVLDPPLTSTVTLTIPDLTSLSPLPPEKSCEEVRLSVLAKSWTEDLTGYLSSGLWADVEIRCGETDQVTFRCHKMLLAAASPFLGRCLRSVADLDEMTSLVLPDFTVQQVREFLNTVYLQWREVGEGSADALLNFLSDQPVKADQGGNLVKNNADLDFVKFEEKVKKMPVEVKMEEATGSECLGNLLKEKDDGRLENGGEGTSGDGGEIGHEDDADKKEKQEKKSGPHTCDQCGKVFKLRRILKEHMQLHSEPKFECTYKSQGCARKFHLKANLKAHIDVIHLKKKNIPCEICGKMFYNKTHLRSHLEHHNKQKQVCEHCSSSFSCSKSLRDHIKFKHTSVENLPKCLVCLKTYSTPQNLKNHFSRVHMQEKKYVCSECGRMFFEKAELEVHTSVHNPEDQNIECDVCKLMFKNNKTLYYHKKRSHDPQGKKHICHLCGKSYNDAHFLNRHMESHQGKNFQCKQCGKAFSSEHKVKVHIQKVHEKWRRKNEPEKPCPLCDRKFPTWGGMKRHLKDVHKMSVIEANTLLIQRFHLDPKKHRINPSEILKNNIRTEDDISSSLLDNLC